MNLVLLERVALEALYYGKKNIESLGGFVILDSELNKGTTITLKIPPLVFHKNRVA